MWMASPYNRPVSARPGQVVVTARPVAKTALENKTAETSLAAVARDAGPGAETVTVRIKGMRFEPVNVTVKPGTTVTWIQEDRMPHTITGQGNGLRSSTLYGGQEYSHTFTEAGSYEYRCGLHPSMKGSIVVGETGKDT
jgi:plastocyanin